MPNKIAEDRRRVVYIEEKANWKIIQEAAKKNGIPPSAIIRVAVQQMCDKLADNPNTRFINPVFPD